MKKIILLSIFSLFSLFGFSQVTNNFEDGNWLYYYNLCWGIGPNSTYFGTKVTANTNQGFNGTYVMETDNLGATAICRLESPWVEINQGSIISYTHAVPSFNGSRILYLNAIPHTGGNALLIKIHSYTNSTPIVESVNFGFASGKYKIQWLWQGSGGNSRAQLDNITINGTNVSDPSNNCNVYVPPVVPDTTINYYPAADTSTLAFEDLWPNYGDYDMNDLVMGYKFKIVSYTQSGNIKDIYATFIVRAQGAGLLNGFGFQLPTVEPNSIVSVTGVGDQSGYSINSNGTENGQTKAVFIIFDDTHKFMSAWNTVKGGETCPWKTFNVHIKFSQTNPVTLQQLNIHEWNPFLVKNSTRGQEIHLPDYLPTDLADQSLFKTGDDDTQIGVKTYKSKTNLPWAIDIYGKFEYPTETSDISKAYLHFGDWAESNGTTYQDWWLKTSSDYRNSSLIY